MITGSFLKNKTNPKMCLFPSGAFGSILAKAVFCLLCVFGHVAHGRHKTGKEKVL